MQVLSKGSYTARWGHYLLHVWSVQGGWRGRLYHWPRGDVPLLLEELGLAMPLPAPEGLMQMISSGLVDRGCKVLVNGEFRSLHNFLVFETAPVDWE